MNGDGRPDPDDLLRRYGLAMREQTRRRGRLRILLGAAPGVGKTFAMLIEGRRLKSEGRDVAIGLVETHGRPETTAQIGDLEVLPPRTVTYRGLTLTEMDTAAILARNPEIVLIDELAHTNAPNSPRAKRWEDVEAIRDAGIDVIATLNIQHLESISHLVEGITGVKVRETAPDRIVAGSEVQVVDLPVDGLLERLEAGKIYPPERASQALQHFFRAGNLTALRELALRHTAAGVDDRLERYMHEHEIGDVWPAAERVAVLIDGAADGVVRAAWRLASVLRTDLIAIAIESISSAKTTQLAEDLGASVQLLHGEWTAASIAEVLRAENISFLVLGHTAAKRGRLFGPSLVDQLFALVDNVSIQLVEERAQPAS
jgi:two-component system sensor histidine kinase KdpD